MLPDGLGRSEFFAAGTLVRTEHGELLIEQVKVGDKVWARNQKPGENELRPVTAIPPKHRDKLLELRVMGEKDALRVKPVHFIEYGTLERLASQ